MFNLILGFLPTFFIFFALVSYLIALKIRDNLSRRIRAQYPNIIPPNSINILNIKFISSAIPASLSIITGLFRFKSMGLWYKENKNNFYDMLLPEEVKKIDDEEIKIKINNFIKHYQNFYFSCILALISYVILTPLVLLINSLFNYHF